MSSKSEKLSPDDPNLAKNASSAKSKAKSQVVESWEDESISGSETEDGIPAPAEEERSSIPRAPPPTPLSSSPFPTWDTIGQSISPRARNFVTSTLDRDEESRRPEKSTATASRLIAGALGVKAPKKTEEQRAYERAIKEQEIKRRNREIAAKEKEKEEAEKAKTAMWEG